MKLMTFGEALVDSKPYPKRHLLLGNGFSIACRPDLFLYSALFEQADFGKLSPTAKLGFKALQTQDFERVIKALRDARAILEAYGGASPKLLASLQADADGLRELLVETVASTHPAWPGEITEDEFAACRSFLSHFEKVYTLNYDLLLYWTQMHVKPGISPVSDDGFRKPDDDYEASYVTWEPTNSHKQNTWFLHGALHLFDAGVEVQKYTWVNTGMRLIDQIRDALQRNLFPIFVSEGTSDEKLERIRHSDYLAKGYRSFCEIGGALFIYGHSLAENDEHFLKRIEKGKVSCLYVGLYGDPDSDANKRIVRRAEQMADKRKSNNLSVEFYDAATANVWKT
jgi:hypothetical protein